jgi:hypothetical protein
MENASHIGESRRFCLLRFLIASSVSGISLDEDHQVIILSTSVSKWREAVHFVDLSFGPSGEDYELRRHNDLRPRQAIAISSSLASTISLSHPSTTATPTTTDLSYTITQKPLIDTTILPPNYETGFSESGTIREFRC